MPLSSTPRALFVASLLLLLGCHPKLEPGKKIERTIELDEHQRVRLDLKADRFYHLVAEQPTSDVVLTLFDPQGKRVEVDVDATTPGQLEHLYFIPPASGRYSLDVHGLDLSAGADDGEGRYSLELGEPRVPTENDRLVTEAFWAESRGLELDAIAEDCRAAVVEYEKAATLWEKAGRPRDVTLVLIELGYCHVRLGQPIEGHRHYQRALELATETGDHIRRIHALYSLGSTSRALGRLDEAHRFHHEALKVARQAGGVKEIGRALNNICFLYMELGKQELAKETCQQAIEVYDQQGWRDLKITTLNNLGLAHGRQGDWRSALELFEQALDLDPNRTRLTMIGLSHQSRALEELGQPEEALLLLQKALGTSLELGQRSSETRYRGRLASLLLKLGQTERAREEAQAALDLVDEVENVVAQVAAMAAAARVQWLTGSPEEGARTADRAIALFEKMRQSPQDFDDRATFLASRWSIYDLRVAIRMALFAQTEDPAWRDSAFHAAEEARARGLIDRLEPVGGILDAARIHSQLLDAKTGLLLFHLGERESFLWRLADGQVTSFVLPAIGEIQAAAQPLHRALTAREIDIPGESSRARGRRVSESDAEVWRAGGRLTEALRMAEALAGDGIERWIIVPDGVLHQIPFAALPLPGDAEADRPLLTEFEIVYAPSASSLAALRSRSASEVSANGFLALADPVFDIVDSRNPTPAGEVPKAQGLGLARLPLTRNEVLEIAALAPSSSVVATDHAASKERLLAEDLEGFGYLHIATHGLIDEADPSRSALVLSRFDEMGRPIDGRLSLKELGELELGAQLVVLSACRTASGRELRGEGLMGLSRGFMNAGVPRVIASQWAVGDGVTQNLMTSFYRKIWRQGASPSAALREAQLELWRQGLAPYHWAAFSFQGEWL